MTTLKKIITNGFSLLELMITCAIMSLLIVIFSLPFANLFHQTVTKSKTSSLFHFLQFARIEAIKHHQTVYVCGTQDFTHCQQGKLNGYLAYAQNRLAPFKKTILGSNHIPHNVTITFSTYPRIHFNAHGQSRTPCTILIQGQHFLQKIVISTSGRIRLL